MNFSEKILAIREKFSMSQQELGQRLGVTKTAIGLIERGKTASPSAEILSALATKLSISADWLLLGEGEMLKTSPQKAGGQNISSYMPPGLNIYDYSAEPVKAPAAGSKGVSKDLRETETVHHQGRPQLTYSTRALKELSVEEPTPRQLQPPPGDAVPLPGLDLLRQVAQHSKEILELRQQIAQLTRDQVPGQHDSPAAS